MKKQKKSSNPIRRSLINDSNRKVVQDYLFQFAKKFPPSTLTSLAPAVSIIKTSSIKITDLIRKDGWFILQGCLDLTVMLNFKDRTKPTKLVCPVEFGIQLNRTLDLQSVCNFDVNTEEFAKAENIN